MTPQYAALTLFLRSPEDALTLLRALLEYEKQLGSSHWDMCDTDQLDAEKKRAAALKDTILKVMADNVVAA